MSKIPASWVFLNMFHIIMINRRLVYLTTNRILAPVPSIMALYCSYSICYLVFIRIFKVYSCPEALLSLCYLVIFTLWVYVCFRTTKTFCEVKKQAICLSVNFCLQQCLLPFSKSAQKRLVGHLAGIWLHN